MNDPSPTPKRTELVCVRALKVFAALAIAASVVLIVMIVLGYTHDKTVFSAERLTSFTAFVYALQCSLSATLLLSLASVTQSLADLAARARRRQ